LRVEGRITVFGADMAKEPHVALRSLAYMPQVAPPLDAPVKELVHAFCALRARRPEACVTRAAKLGLDLQAVGSKRVRDLSGGMKQKLLAALALTAEAPVLVCDEPTANLDAAARAVFFEEVLARPSTGILVLCSHRVEEVRHLVDRVVRLEEGRLVSDASLAQALEALRAFRVELTFREAVSSADAEALLARGFTRVTDARYHGHFSETPKVEVVGRCVTAFGPRLLDLSVQDAEALHATPAKVIPLRSVS
jgi:ABC-2 type transport system ATP-binding protein